ncbi:hypothetical protein RE432_18350 [Pusillimonas sp. SM2304]|uniref:hypothetical protein n=1 Tax=Pusillimonas sp. SM2304 TaxID=3073241 RepID=UPI0028744745|nr:hypothetical protein [Pusillimonas sp. SM2304]MDS1142399.1 hypothetical protein [Pusillimonas sp. SM2304]
MADEKNSAAQSAQKWLDALKCVENDTDNKNWADRSKKIVRRYRDERSNFEACAKFNILWSNTETIFPAIYSRTPKAEVSRRNKDADPVARTASRILERALQYEIDQYPDFDDSMRAAILDRLLPGRGTVWIRFEEYEIARPEGEDAPALEIDAAAAPPAGQMAGEPGATSSLQNWGALLVEDEQEAESPEIKEHACVDYVYWEDFRHGQARVWADVPWVGRRVYMRRDEGIERFGEGFREVPLTQEPIGIDEKMRESGALDDLKKAAVWEIWDKDSKTAVWVAEGFAQVLDTKPDPYGLEGFFPCPKPLFATQTTDQITPVPDFVLYQDQADELDLLTTRINGLVGALRLAGAYDQSQPALARILQSPDNELIPVENWAALSEKGGLAGVMEFVPIKDVAAALQAAYAAREQAKQVIYEITGISDIIRGATKASETYGAQEIKRQFGSLRLQTRQRDVAKYATDILRIKAQLMMDVYSPETLLAMSGIMDTEDGQYADQAMQLLQSEPLREYQITVAADSLVAMDEEQEKASRMEFLQAIGGYIERAMQAAQSVPEIAPLALELMMFAVRAFPAAKPIEGAFEQFQEAMRNKPPQDPNAGARAEQEAEMAKLRHQGQVEQMRLEFQARAKQAELAADAQANQIRAAADVQIQQAKTQMQSDLEIQRANMQADLDRYKAGVDARGKAAIASMQMDFQRWKAELDAAVKVQVANISSKAKVDNAATATATNEIVSEVTQ